MKKVIITLLVIFILSLAGVAFAFWASSVSVEPDPDNTFLITIGSPDGIETELKIGGMGCEYGTLVPVGGAVGNSLTPATGDIIEYILLPITIKWDGEALDENYESKFADFTIILTKALSTDPYPDDIDDEDGEVPNVSLGFLEAFNLVEIHLYPLPYEQGFSAETIVDVVEEEIDFQKGEASFITAENILTAMEEVGLETLGATDTIQISYHDSIDLLLVVWINKASPISIGYLIDCIITITITVTASGFAIYNPIEGLPIKKPIIPSPPIKDPS